MVIKGDCFAQPETGALSGAICLKSQLEITDAAQAVVPWVAKFASANESRFGNLPDVLADYRAV
jgi:hypothetical protein